MEVREIAFNIFKENKGKITSRAIAEELNIKLSKVNYWRKKDNWKKRIKGGAQPGNQNAIGNKGGGAPQGNLNNFKHGGYIDERKFLSKKFLAKYIPKATQNIINEIQESGINSLDILWTNITVQLAAILRSQKIMHVKSKNDTTKVLKRESWGENGSEEYELQFAWDKQSTFLQTQSKAMKTLESMINSYEKLLHTNWDMASEEQKARLELIRAQTNKLTGDDLEIEDLEEIESEVYGQ